MKKFLIIMSISLLLSSCNNNIDKIKSLKFDAETLGDELTISSNIEIVDEISTKYPNKMMLYKISPRKITHEIYEEYKNFFNIEGDIVEKSDSIYVQYDDNHNSRTGKKQFYVESGNRIVYKLVRGENKITKVEEEMIAEATSLIKELPFIDSEYIYSTSNTRTMTKMYPDGTTEEDLIVGRMLNFVRVLDGYTVLGEDQCHVYFDSMGLCGISISFYNYEKTNEIEIINKETAIKSISHPAKISIDSDDENHLKGKANKVIVKKSSLYYCNQYSQGVEMLQPLYAFKGPIYSNDSKSNFTARIKAVPEKYTYDN